VLEGSCAGCSIRTSTRSRTRRARPRPPGSPAPAPWRGRALSPGETLRHSCISSLLARGAPAPAATLL